jgi:hypothetical protein
MVVTSLTMVSRRLGTDRPEISGIAADGVAMPGFYAVPDNKQQAVCI